MDDAGPATVVSHSNYSNLLMKNCEVWRGTYGIGTGTGENIRLENVTVSGASLYSIVVAYGHADCYNITTGGPATSLCLQYNGNISLKDYSYSEASPVTFIHTFGGEYVKSLNNDLGGSDIIRTPLGVIESDTSVRHTETGVSWKLSPTTTTADANAPLIHYIGYIFCEENVEKTISVWMRRSISGITGTLKIASNELSGISNDVTATMTASADTWEQLQIAFTPTESGFVTITIEAYGGTTYSVYWDDLSVSPDASIDATSGDYTQINNVPLIVPSGGTSSGESAFVFSN